MTKLRKTAIRIVETVGPSLGHRWRTALPNLFAWSVGVVFLSASICSGQSELSAHGFDPTPVKLGKFEKAPKRAITSLDLLQMRRVLGVKISPDGKSIAFVLVQALVATNSYRTGLFVASTSDKNKVAEFGSAGPPEFDSLGQLLSIAPQWSPDSSYVTLCLPSNGVRQITRWPREGGPPEQLTRSQHDVQTYEWSKDGKEIVYRTVAPIDLTAVRTLAQQGLVYDGTIRASRAKPVTELLRERQSRAMDWWKYSVSTGHERRLSSDEIKQQQADQNIGTTDTGVYVARRSPDGKSTAYIKRLQSPQDFKYYGWSLINQDYSGRRIILVPATNALISDIHWSNTGDKIYFAEVSVNGAGLFEVPASGGPIRRLIRSVDPLSNFSFDASQQSVACVIENTISPPNIALIRVSDRRVVTLTDLNPEFQTLNLSAPSRLDWSNEYGDAAFGYLFKPLDFDSNKSYPLIITTYTAGGFLSGAVGDEFPIQVFAAHGFLVLAFNAPDRRPADPGDFKTQMLTWYSPLSSLEVVVRKLVREELVDPNRIGLTGLSYGAEITEFAITHSSMFAAAATGGWSARDPIFYYLAHDGWRRIFTDWMGSGPEGKGQNKWRELSPALNVTNLTAPLLVQAAESEYLCGLQLYTTLKEREVPVELIIYPNEGHVKNQPAHKYFVYERNLAWFKFWLLEKTPKQKSSWSKEWSEFKEKSVSPPALASRN
ncbi:MAG TPA: Atxe2 family lasso peptide isopeptidase [Pyrinomonadaceae bacterium]|nr:Atxe2 family lasso peptide isopeptidase [Pyrinomonadaceae bacterium]